MSEETHRSILVLRLSALGDIVHAMPAVSMLRHSLPESSIGWVVERRFEEIVRYAAPVDRVFVVDTRSWMRRPLSRRTRSSLSDVVEALREFSAGGCSIDFQGLIKSGLFAWKSGAKERFGFAWEAIREKAALMFVNRRVSIDRRAHVVDWNRQLVVAAGAKRSSSMEVDWSRFAIDHRSRLAPIAGVRPVAILPGTGSTEKNWSAEHWIEVARELIDVDRAPVWVVWGPGEEEGAHRIARESGAEMAPPTDLRELGFLLRHARLVVGGDTGPLHLAAALGTPVVGLFGPTRVERNGPWGQLSRCVASSAKGGMAGISPGNVRDRIRAVLAEAPSGGSDRPAESR